jgi:excisionase family DNA binding protein
MGLTEEDRKRLKGNGAAIERLAVKPLEAAMMLGQSRSAVYRLINTGQLHAVKAGGSTLVLTKSIREYVENLPRFGSRTAQEETAA